MYTAKFFQWFQLTVTICQYVYYYSTAVTIHLCQYRIAPNFRQAKNHQLTQFSIYTNF